MSFLDFADELNYNLKETELKEEALFLKNNKVCRVKEQKVAQSKDIDESVNELGNEKEEEVLH